MSTMELLPHLPASHDHRIAFLEAMLRLLSPSRSTPRNSLIELFRYLKASPKSRLEGLNAAHEVNTGDQRQGLDHTIDATDRHTSGALRKPLGSGE